MSILAHARDYAAIGWPVFPCKPHSKAPATRNGFKAATVDPDRIRAWWADRPDRNLAIATGERAGLVVLDVDPRHAGDAMLDRLLAEHGELPRTVRAETGGGGYHLLFRHPGGFVKSRSNALGRGIDVKADGGYIIAPPSVHPGGGVYRWTIAPTDSDVAEAPSWLLAMLTQSSSNEAPHCCISESLSICCSVYLCLSLEDAIASTLPADAGQRNRAVFNFARTLQAMPDYADSEPLALRGIVHKWHKAAAPLTSGEHPFSDTWSEFAYAWPRIEYPKGTGPMAELLKKADSELPPACATDYDATTQRLVCLCRELQRNAGDQPFFVAYRVIAELLGIDRTKAGRLMNMLCVDGVLTLVYRGHTGRSSEYHYVGD